MLLGLPPGLLAIILLIPPVEWVALLVAWPEWVAWGRGGVVPPFQYIINCLVCPDHIDGLLLQILVGGRCPHLYDIFKELSDHLISDTPSLVILMASCLLNAGLTIRTSHL
jgi:hypothetical protein